MAQNSMPPTKVLAQILGGNLLQQAVYVATRLGIPDLLAAGPRCGDDLAAITGVDPSSLRRVLRALAAQGIFAEVEDGAWTLTPAAALLRADAPGSWRPFALWSGGVSYQACGGLEWSVRTGRPAFERIFGAEFFDYLARNPDSSEIFDEMMAWNTSPVAPILAARDWSGVRTVVDVGGGRGDLLAAILAANPGLRGVLVEHPRLGPRAGAFLDASGVGDRCEFVACDFTDCDPPEGDVYLLKCVVHGLDDQAAARLLGRCRRSSDGRACVLLVEFLIPPGNDPFPGKGMDLLMMVGCRGRERTEAEFRTLLAEAGFRLASCTDARNGYSVIEALAGLEAVARSSSARLVEEPAGGSPPR